MRATHWGYCPDWARAQNLPQTINARAETAASGRYFKDLWKTGRVLVPVDGWFEWRMERPEGLDAEDPPAADEDGAERKLPVRQPYFVRLKRDEPMYLAALSNVRGTEPQTDGMGLVIVTATADAGLIDVHDRRPLVFAPEAARRWLDPALAGPDLEHLARHACVPAGKFRWYRVSPDVDRLLNDEPRLIEALQ